MDEYAVYMIELAHELGISEDHAEQVHYLRSRSRWTQELEDELIRMGKCGEPLVNMSEWPPEEMRQGNPVKELVDRLWKDKEKQADENS